jgi:hypothetical protein
MISNDLHLMKGATFHHQSKGRACHGPRKPLISPSINLKALIPDHVTCQNPPPRELEASHVDI